MDWSEELVVLKFLATFREAGIILPEDDGKQSWERKRECKR